MTYGNWRDLKREKASSAKAHKRTLNQTPEQAMSGVWKVKDLEELNARAASGVIFFCWGVVYGAQVLTTTGLLVVVTVP